MPKLGMTMTEGTLLRWLYQEGDMVEKGEPVAEVMTDKVNLEIEAPFTGRLAHILAHDGDTLPVGAPLATLVVAQSDAPGSAGTAPAPTDLSPQPASERVASTPAAKREAALHTINLREVVQSGAQPPLTRADIVAFVESRPNRTLRATPLAQKIARQHRVDLSAIPAGRRGEKVTRADVEAHLATGQAGVVHTAQTPATATEPTEPATPALPTPVTSAAQTTPPTTRLSQVPPATADDSEIIPLSPVRRLIGQRMLSSITTAPHIYLDMEIDMSEAERCRQHVARSLRDEPAPSLTALLIRALAAALVQHPEVNATLEVNEPGKEVIRRWHAVHIGVAVDTEQALLTPVIRNAHRQTLAELARNLRRLTRAAREGTLRPEEMAHATFTISNLGMYGIDTFHAIIAPGQSAILAVGKVTRRGVVIADEQGERLEIRPIMKVSLSADHRVLDGASGSRFLQRFKALLEEPYLLI